MNDAERMIMLVLVRQIELQQVATEMLRRMLPELEEMNRRLEGLIFKYDPTSVSRPSYQLQRAVNMTEEAAKLIQDVMRELSRRTEQDFDDLWKITEEDEKRNHLLIYGLALLYAAPLVAKPTIQGVRVRDYFDQASERLAFQFQIAVRDSVEGAGTAAEIAARWGGRTEFGVAGIDPTKRALETLLRTGVSGIPSEVQSRATPTKDIPSTPEVQPHEGKISPHGWQHISVLDSRTTPTCRSRAWKRWDADRKPVGHSLPYAVPPLHENCRSRLTMVFLDDPPSKEMEFKDFMDGLNTDQKIKLFGTRQLRAWEKGTITDSQLIRQQTKALSVDKLRQRTLDKGTVQTVFPYF